MCLQAQMCKMQACAPSFFQHCAHQVLQSRPNPSCTKEQCCRRRACTGPKKGPAQGQHNRPAQGQCSIEWMKGSSKLHHSQSIHLDHVSPSSDVQSASMRTILFSALCPPSFAESAESKLHQRAMLPKKGLHRAKERACTGPAQQTCSGSMQHRMDEGPLHHHRWSIHTINGKSTR